MNAERQREIARKGGRAAHEKGTAHQFTSDEARAAGRKGGERVSQDRDHMAAIGRMGGRRSAGRRGSKSAQESQQSPPTEGGAEPNPGQMSNPGSDRIESEEGHPT